MPYYMGDCGCSMPRGDYYRGDYYRGDPAFTLKSILGGIGKTALGFVTGGPVGAIAGAASAWNSMAQPPVSSACPPGQTRIGNTCVNWSAAAPGGTPFTQPATASMPSPCGYHVNKRTYCTIKGGVVPAGTKWVRNRRMNPMNPRAVSRAARRIEAGIGMYKRLYTIKHGCASPGFKLKGKRRARR